MAYSVRTYRQADAEGVRRLLVATYGEKAPPQSTFEWWAFQCPTAESGCMVAEINGRIVGVQPMEMFSFAYGDRTSKGGLLTGVAVHPDFRRQGIFSALIAECEREAWQKDCDFVTTMPNERSRPGFLKLGYCDLGRRTFLVHAMNAPRMGKLLAKRAGPLGYAAGVALAGAQKIIKRLPRNSMRQAREVREIDEEIGEMEVAHSRLFPGLRIRRDAAWWRWRYLASPSTHYRLFESRQQGRLTGMAAIVGEERHSVLVSYILDIAVTDLETFESLIAAIFEAAKAAGFQAVATVVSSPDMLKLLQRNGFWRVPLWMPIKRFFSVARFNPNREESLPRDWRSIDHWNQTLGDWDNL